MLSSNDLKCLNVYMVPTIASMYYKKSTSFDTIMSSTTRASAAVVYIPVG